MFAWCGRNCCLFFVASGRVPSRSFLPLSPRWLHNPPPGSDRGGPGVRRRRPARGEGHGGVPGNCPLRAPPFVPEITISGCQDETLLSLIRLGRVRLDTVYGVPLAGRTSGFERALLQRVALVAAGRLNVVALGKQGGSISLSFGCIGFGTYKMHVEGRRHVTSRTDQPWRQQSSSQNAIFNKMQKFHIAKPWFLGNHMFRQARRTIPKERP